MSRKIILSPIVGEIPETGDIWGEGSSHYGVDFIIEPPLELVDPIAASRRAELAYEVLCKTDEDIAEAVGRGVISVGFTATSGNITRGFIEYTSPGEQKHWLAEKKGVSKEGVAQMVGKVLQPLFSEFEEVKVMWLEDTDR